MFIYIVFLLFISYHISLGQYDLSNVASGTKMSVNDDMFVSASNTFSNFAVLMHPYRNATAGGSIRCNMRYNTTDRFVHSVAVVGIAKNSTTQEQFMFVFAAERMSTMTPYVCIGTIASINSTCVYKYQCTDMAAPGSHQEYFLIGVDTNGTYAYGFTSTFAFKLDIYANQLIVNTTTQSMWPSQGFIPHALDVADTWAVVAGYEYTIAYKQDYETYACLIDLTTFKNASCVQVTTETTFLIPGDVVSYLASYELSVSIRGNKVIVGVPRIATVTVLYNLGTSLNISRINTLSSIDSTSVGRIVDWADDTTIAILVEDPYETSWSTTQIFFYDERSVTTGSPIFSFPNNQQILGTRLLRPSFARFSITSKGNMAILTSNADILIIPNAPAGYASRWIDTTDRVFVFYYQPKLCIGGTYKNLTSLGPCQICPPNTQNPGTLTSGITQCIPCSNDSSNSFCPLASLTDIDLSTVHSYSQSLAYPETGDTTDVENLLVKNVFQISSNPHCLLISPILWTGVVVALCVLVLIFMSITHALKCKAFIECGKKAKKIFKQTDIIGEGEMWMGGLATLAILVLVSFAYWFSVSFIRRYPIEEVLEPATFACDETLVNSQFSTGLQLLTIPKSQEAQPIFDLLDQQTFNLTIELINTGFTCNSVTTQENLRNSKYVPLSMDCQQSIIDATTSVTIPLPKHDTTVQINMTGPYWIGGIRLCIRGQGRISTSYTLRELDFCEFYTTSNQAIGRLTSIPITFIRNINMTQGLSESDSTLYSGLWMPTFSTIDLSDEDYYVEFGNYLRYTSSLTVIQVILDEHPFYIKNIQQPIVRTPELIFHGLLFTSLCIELFAFSFLIIKLFIMPVYRWGFYLWKKLRNLCYKSDDSDTSTSSTRKSSKLKGKVNKTSTSRSDSFTFNQIEDDENRSYATSEIELDSIQTICRF
ncbi:unnamed protein product [Adineta steineri]|uniref:Uncharacterized protein n=1 Tax=Adineta steineri TaxID=433720 RepID=A0A815UR19_9BILA|nr:unnamed protein product [Adineta steineri]